MGLIDKARQDLGRLVAGEDHPEMHRILDALAERIAGMEADIEWRREQFYILSACVGRIAELESACQSALAYITGDGWDGTIGQHADNPLPAQLRAALKTGERKWMTY